MESTAAPIREYHNMYRYLRPLIFKFKPEQAHVVTIAMLGLGGSNPISRTLLSAWFQARQAGPQVQAFGLTFPNPLGMAAGYDKDGLGWRGLATLGFGHIEVGTVTPRPQPGNPTPRIFRLVDDRAAINRMGFPNHGAEYLAKRLRGGRPKNLVLGVNIGKNKVTPNEEAVQDYLSLLRTFAPLSDYLAVNVSSPNTPGLRSLQSRKALEDLLIPLAAERAEQVKKLNKPVPILVKLAPDLTPEELDQALDAILATGMDGAIISNTTIRREGLESPLQKETGGLSGAPLNARNTALVRQVVQRTGGRLPVVASGGVMNSQDAQAKLDAGAVLVQLYTGLIYAGPGLVRDILNDGIQTRPNLEARRTQKIYNQ
jgi:dihydroorotate dehydrogenase